jgi:hypothetical protein
MLYSFGMSGSVGGQLGGGGGCTALCGELLQRRARSQAQFELACRPVTKQSQGTPNDQGVASICLSLLHGNEPCRRILFDWQLV